MQILAVPLARQRATAKTYLFYAVRASQAEKEKGPPIQPSLTQRMMNRASAFWINLGRTDVRSVWNWRRRTFLLGERIMDRVPYQEWELKNIDQELGPSIRSILEAHKQKKETSPLQVEYAPQLTGASEAVNSLGTLEKDRKPYHFRYFLYSMIGIPITAPLFLVPVIPNFVTYYLMWRAWSHWRAYATANELTVLLQKNLIEPVPNSELDDFLAARQASEALNGWDLYLQRDHIVPLVKTFGLSSQGAIDLRRAHEQILQKIQK